MPDFSYETRFGRDSGKVVCGVDEVGRGPLAGPVVAAALVLPRDFPEKFLAQIRDSKKMTAAARERLFAPLTDLCPHAIAEANAAEIDRINILQASMEAMRRAVTALHATID
ncbi:MAG: ribonuclease HII, partial [Alphaproteobacteria bacterium]|nr:ribonuclease HII [Alphaproteobacteria bacterium]